MNAIFAAIRVLLGMVCLLNGLNWFFKIITPYPSMSDFVDYLPPPDIVGALIEHGMLFHLAKGVELVAGIALLANRFVPLALVLAMTVSVPVFIVDVFRPEFRLRAFLMGTGTLALNSTLLIAYLAHYRPMLAYRADAGIDPRGGEVPDGGPAADIAVRAARPVLAPLAVLSLLLGTVQVGWLLLLVGQHAADPRAIHEVRPMEPRPLE